MEQVAAESKIIGVGYIESAPGIVEVSITLLGGTVLNQTWHFDATDTGTVFDQIRPLKEIITPDEFYNFITVGGRHIDGELYSNDDDFALESISGILKRMLGIKTKLVKVGDASTESYLSGLNSTVLDGDWWNDIEATGEHYVKNDSYSTLLTLTGALTEHPDVEADKLREHQVNVFQQVNIGLVAASKKALAIHDKVTTASKSAASKGNYAEVVDIIETAITELKAIPNPLALVKDGTLFADTVIVNGGVEQRRVTAISKIHALTKPQVIGLAEVAVKALKNVTAFVIDPKGEVSFVDEETCKDALRQWEAIKSGDEALDNKIAKLGEEYWSVSSDEYFLLKWNIHDIETNTFLTSSIRAIVSWINVSVSNKPKGSVATESLTDLIGRIGSLFGKSPKTKENKEVDTPFDWTGLEARLKKTYLNPAWMEGRVVNDNAITNPDIIRHLTIPSVHGKTVSSSSIIEAANALVKNDSYLCDGIKDYHKHVVKCGKRISLWMSRNLHCEDIGELERLYTECELQLQQFQHPYGLKAYVGRPYRITNAVGIDCVKAYDPKVGTTTFGQFVVNTVTDPTKLPERIESLTKADITGIAQMVLVLLKHETLTELVNDLASGKWYTTTPEFIKFMTQYEKVTSQFDVNDDYPDSASFDDLLNLRGAGLYFHYPALETELKISIIKALVYAIDQSIELGPNADVATEGLMDMVKGMFTKDKLKVPMPSEKDYYKTLKESVDKTVLNAKWWSNVETATKPITSKDIIELLTLSGDKRTSLTSAEVVANIKALYGAQSEYIVQINNVKKKLDSTAKAHAEKLSKVTTSQEAYAGLVAASADLPEIYSVAKSLIIDKKLFNAKYSAEVKGDELKESYDGVASSCTSIEPLTKDQCIEIAKLFLTTPIRWGHELSYQEAIGTMYVDSNEWLHKCGHHLEDKGYDNQEIGYYLGIFVLSDYLAPKFDRMMTHRVPLAILAYINASIVDSRKVATESYYDLDGRMVVDFK